MRLAIAAVALALVGCAGPARAATGPFTWDGASWCPTYQVWRGCNGTTPAAPTGTAVGFSPDQVAAADGTVTLTMNQDETYSGAITTQGQETYQPGASWSERITLACTPAGQIENWPAFWTTAYPAPGEIDILEGLHGYATWNVHYVNAAGHPASIQGRPPGDWCGTHTYAASWAADAITFTWDGMQVGQVTPAQMGVPMFTSPEQMINDYAEGTPGGPAAPGASMILGAP